ncbi:MAG: hypothetical protein AAGF11_34200 [Myxococcota bacterium]
MPGSSEPPPHDDYVELDNPSRRSGLYLVTYFDLRDINTVDPSDVEVRGLFPRRQFDELTRRLANLGA